MQNPLRGLSHIFIGNPPTPPRPFTPSNDKDPVTTELEQQRLRVEIRKLTAEADKEEIYLATSQEGRLMSNFKARMIHFNDRVDSYTVANCMEMVRAYASLDPTGRIEIIFNSGGGSVLDGLELYDHIMAARASGTPIDTTILGLGASMAGVLSQAGEVRRMGKHAHLMIHEIASLNFGTLSSIKDSVKFSERLYDRLLGILAERSKLTIDEIRAHADRRDWWLDSEESLKFGFIDSVVPSVESSVA